MQTQVLCSRMSLVVVVYSVTLPFYITLLQNKENSDSITRN